MLVQRKQHTVTREKKETELIARGRHDPCVVLRGISLFARSNLFIIFNIYIYIYISWKDDDPSHHSDQEPPPPSLFLMIYITLFIKWLETSPQRAEYVDMEIYRNSQNLKTVIYWYCNSNKALVPKCWSKLWFLNRLIEVGHMYYSPPIQCVPCRVRPNFYL